jgi:hypothetical protein
VDVVVQTNNPAREARFIWAWHHCSVLSLVRLVIYFSGHQLTKQGQRGVFEKCRSLINDVRTTIPSIIMMKKTCEVRV